MSCANLFHFLSLTNRMEKIIFTVSSQSHFSLDKEIIGGIVNLTSPRIFSLSKGGDGWRKTFKILLTKF